MRWLSVATLVVLVSLVTAVSPASAQSAIAAVVKDASGGVLPGVTVEAASPALIEGSRTAATDGSGQYKIIDLRPGVYTVPFSLSGFQTVRREEIQLPPGATSSWGRPRCPA